jgi:hypothetical protein
LFFLRVNIEELAARLWVGRASWFYWLGAPFRVDP